MITNCLWPIRLQIKESEMEYLAAIDLYLRANLPVRAARVITTHPHLAENQELVQSIAMTLIKAQLYVQVCLILIWDLQLDRWILKLDETIAELLWFVLLVQSVAWEICGKNGIRSVAKPFQRVSLFKHQFQAGELFEKTKDFQRALRCYEEGKAFNKAVELSRMAFPEEVIRLEEAWGDNLVAEKQVDAAINHYIGWSLYFELISSFDLKKFWFIFPTK